LAVFAAAFSLSARLDSDLLQDDFTVFKHGVILIELNHFVHLFQQTGFEYVLWLGSLLDQTHDVVDKVGVVARVLLL